MLSKEDNELLTRVDDGAPMAAVLRRYWLPVFRSADLVAGGAPRRVPLVGEKLVIFRDTSGKVGLLDEFCPHRGASLVLARNADCALQCLYHGWRIDRHGKVVETPSEPGDSTFKDRVRQVAYPVREAGGLIWAYLGDPGEVPDFPAFEWTERPAEHTLALRAVLNYNWVQALEGVIDSAHVGFLHTDYLRRLVDEEDPYDGGEESLITKVMVDGKPKLEVENTKYGFRYGAIRKATREDGTPAHFVRVTHFVAPIWGIIPTRPGWSFFQAFVPIDDHHTVFYFVLHRANSPVGESTRAKLTAWNGLDQVDDEFRLTKTTPDTLWGQDRQAMMEGKSFSGIGGYPPLEDIAVQESMGPIYDRTREHLGTSDLAVIRMRRIMIAAARTVAAGAVPPGLDGTVDFGSIKAEEAIIDTDTSWTTVGAPLPKQGQPTPA